MFISCARCRGRESDRTIDRQDEGAMDETSLQPHAGPDRPNIHPIILADQQRTVEYVPRRKSPRSLGGCLDVQHVPVHRPDRICTEQPRRIESSWQPPREASAYAASCLDGERPYRLRSSFLVPPSGGTVSGNNEDLGTAKHQYDPTLSPEGYIP